MYAYDLQSCRNSLTPDALCPHIIIDYLSMWIMELNMRRVGVDVEYLFILMLAPLGL